MEENLYEDLKTYNECVRNLEELKTKRKYALVGALGSVYLIASNITLAGNTSIELLTTGTVIFPSFFTYLNSLQEQINHWQYAKNSYVNGTARPIGKHQVKIEYQPKQQIEEIEGYEIISIDEIENKLIVTYSNNEYIYSRAGRQNTFGEPLKTMTKHLHKSL